MEAKPDVHGDLTSHFISSSSWRLCSLAAVWHMATQTCKANQKSAEDTAVLLEDTARRQTVAVGNCWENWWLETMLPRWGMGAPKNGGGGP